jgi:hypothetical protein
MKLAITAVVTSAFVGLGLAACGTTTVVVPASSATPRPASSPVPASSPGSPASSPGSAVTRQAAPASPAPASPAPVTTVTRAPVTPAPAPPANTPNVTDPWAVVSAYYGAIESGDYQEAWALINYGATTGQTYQQFVNGFTCTGSQQLTEVSASATQVTFDLTATDACSGQVQHFAGTDTVENGKIVAADVRQTG